MHLLAKSAKRYHRLGEKAPKKDYATVGKQLVSKVRPGRRRVIVVFAPFFRRRLWMDNMRLKKS